MIRFGLKCDCGHAFEGWFASSSAFEEQAARDLVSCPVCDGTKVRKGLMAPQVSTSRGREAARARIGTQIAETQARIAGELRKLRDHVTANAENVGDRFAQTAREIHYGETPDRAVYGKASKDEVDSLKEEGVPVAPLPPVPEDAN